MQGTIIIGEVLKPQGVRGEIKIKPYIDDFADIRNFKTLFIAGKEYKVLACRTDPSAAYLALSGIADRDAAELLRGKEVEALRSEAPAPALKCSAAKARTFRGRASKRPFSSS